MKTIFISSEQYAQDVRATVRTIAGNLKMAQHPLYTGLLTGSDEQLKAIGIPTPNEVVAFKLKQLEAAAAVKDVVRYVFTHERPWRLHAFLDTREWGDGSDEWKVKWFSAAGEVWIDSEAPGRNADIWRSEVFSSADRFLMMNSEEFTEFRGLTELTVYRGADTKTHARGGLSWTKDRDLAEWFARRYASKSSWLASATVKREQVTALFSRRGEKEIVLAKIPRGVKVERI